MLSFEVHLTKKYVSQKEWSELIHKISDYNGILKPWNFIISIHNNQIRYFINTTCSLPSIINNHSSFILKRVGKKKIVPIATSFPIIKRNKNMIDLLEYFEIKGKGKLRYIEIHFRKVRKDKMISASYLYLLSHQKVSKRRLLFTMPSYLLSIHFEENKKYTFKGTPKYLDMSKNLHLLSSDKASAILKVDVFPYLQGDFYLKPISYHFDKHSVVVGSSGCGKSKFISLFIENIQKSKEFSSQYKVVLIDPHASLEKDVGGLGKVIDFKSLEDSIDLFINKQDDAIVSTELLLELLKSLIKDQYNSKLERVLRHAIHTLLVGECFNFCNLRKIVLESEYRNTLLKELEDKLPFSVISFFLSDFNDLKTKSYGEAISPIISFIDEMEIFPVFHEALVKGNLKDTIKENFLTLFSLNRTKLGEKVVKAVAGLLMQQLLIFIQNREVEEHIIFIVDEVAIVENPILSRFLSEARKYNLSLILIGQYFNQISKELRDAIFANVVNYYIFRVSRLDANILVDNFNMKIPLNDDREQKIKLLSELKVRECIIRIDSNGCLLPAMKASTLDFKSIPRKQYESKKEEEKNNISSKKTKFHLDKTIPLKDILITTSSSRKDVR